MVKTPSFLRANLDEKRPRGGILTSTLGPSRAPEGLCNTRSSRVALLPPSSNLSLPKTHLPRRTGSRSNQVLGLLSASLFFLVFGSAPSFPASYAKHRLFSSLGPPFCLVNLPSYYLAGHHLDPAADGHNLSSSSLLLLFHHPARSADSAGCLHICL